MTDSNPFPPASEYAHPSNLIELTPEVVLKGIESMRRAKLNYCSFINYSISPQMKAQLEEKGWSVIVKDRPDDVLGMYVYLRAPETDE